MLEQLPPPRILAPGSVSEEAARITNVAVPPIDWPALDDWDRWRQLVEMSDAATLAMAEARMPSEGELACEKTDIGGVTTYVLTPRAVSADANPPLFLDFHGGALIMCSGELSWKLFSTNAVERAGITWSPDYRNPPEHPFPAALDDCVALYREALKVREPSEIVISGGSAGGNLAAAVLLRAKDEGLPMPAGLVLLSPEVDLTESGDSFKIVGDLGYIGSLAQINLLYGGGHDLAHPYLSPLFGDVSGFPPTFLHAGTRDFFLSNTVRLHRKLLHAGVEAELHIFEAMPHEFGWGHSPEEQDLRASQRMFEQRVLRRTDS